MKNIDKRSNCMRTPYSITSKIPGHIIFHSYSKNTHPKKVEKRDRYIYAKIVILKH